MRQNDGKGDIEMNRRNSNESNRTQENANEEQLRMNKSLKASNLPEGSNISPRQSKQKANKDTGN